MNQKISALIARYPALTVCARDIERAYECIRGCFAKGGRLYLCGNGGSASDCEHIAGELLKSFLVKRPIPEEYAARLALFGEEGKALAEGLEGALPVVSLCGHPGFSTAYANDRAGVFSYAQLVNAWVREGDVLLAISTSGNSANCVYASMAAKARGAEVVALTGEGGGKLLGVADVTIAVPERETYLVQELHLPVYHCLCAMLEAAFFA